MDTTELYRLSTAPAAQRLGLGRAQAPLAPTSCHVAGHYHSDAKPSEHGVPIPQGTRRAPRPDRHHVLLALLIEHPAGLSVLMRPLSGNSREAHEQRLYEWCCDTPHKAGAKRQTLDVTTCFLPWLGWIVALWASKQMVLALDATSLGARFVVLTLSVVYRGCAIPVAWTVLPANQPGAWRREWLRLLRRVRPAIPPAWTVLVLADRGWWARWLFRRIVRLGWPPLLRINQGAKFQPAGQRRWYWLRELVCERGQSWRGRGTAFVSAERRLDCTLVAWWGEGDTEPWFLLTDLAPEGCAAAWYGLRGWGEQGFKCFKRGGWQWPQTQMSAPDRAARLWLALAVATLWMVSVGGAVAGGPGSEDSLARSAALDGRHRGHARPTAPLAGVAPKLVVVPSVSDHYGRPASATALRPRALTGDTCWGVGSRFPSERLGMQ